MRPREPEKNVLVCKVKGQSDRFFGKYKSFEDGLWKRIPGGEFPSEFNTKEKALLFANAWFEEAKADRDVRLGIVKPPADPTWDDICDAYLEDVKAKLNIKGSTQHEAISVTNASIRRGILAVGKPSENDETRCLTWLRALARQNIATPGSPPRVRLPMTVRNIAKHLRYLFRVALRRKLIAGMTTNPTLGDDFRAEIKALVASSEQREWLLPIESFGKLVACSKVPLHRRIEYLVLGLSGLRPGELAGLQFKHLQGTGNERFFAVEQQWKEGRVHGGNAGIDTPKTKWAHRNVPMHRAVRTALDVWINSGWEDRVGRNHHDDDFVFPNEEGKARRVVHATTFRRDLKAAGCSTKYAGQDLKPYALRHLFSTLLMEAHAADAAHDRMMGHRPKDTKTLNYSAKLIGFLTTELERVPFELPEGAPGFVPPTSASEQAPAAATNGVVVEEEPADTTNGVVVEEPAARQEYAA